MIEHYAHFFETLNPDFNDNDFTSVFSEDAVFSDPFQRVVGVGNIIAIFRHMYTTLHQPRFKIIETMGDDAKGYIRWHFYYNDTSFEGVSHVQFDPDGKISSHTDYWDAASNVYEQIPLLGSILRFIKKRLSAL